MSAAANSGIASSRQPPLRHQSWKAFLDSSQVVGKRVSSQSKKISVDSGCCQCTEDVAAERMEEHRDIGSGQHSPGSSHADCGVAVVLSDQLCAVLSTLPSQSSPSATSRLAYPSCHLGPGRKFRTASQSEGCRDLPPIVSDFSLLKMMSCSPGSVANLDIISGLDSFRQPLGSWQLMDACRQGRPRSKYPSSWYAGYSRKSSCTLFWNPSRGSHLRPTRSSPNRWNWSSATNSSPFPDEGWDWLRPVLP
mmetsp:Transcript_23459/g.54405  ORF Transcript_23459/g.54405 Transcript_23459/m.54405 type:complete len:250 (+) Transcript_23459:220-969(+)